MWQFLQAVVERDFLVGLLLFIVGGQALWILALLRRTSCLLELLMRTNERVISSNNETSRIHLQNYVAGARPLLSDLAHEHVEDWELTFDEEGDT